MEASGLSGSNRVRYAAANIILLGSVVVYSYTGFAKVAGFGAFREALAAHGVLPETLQPAVAVVVPIIEVLVAAGTLYALLSLRSVRLWSVAVAGVMLCLLAYSIVLALNPPLRPVGCGCGLDSPIVYNWWMVVLRNSAFFLVMVMATVVTRTSEYEAWVRGRVVRP